MYILYFKVIVETKPNYLIMIKSGSHILVYFTNYTYKNRDSFGIDNILYSNKLLIDFYIFSEVVTLNFYDIDKNTKYKIIERGDYNLIDDLKISLYEISSLNSITLIQ